MKKIVSLIITCILSISPMLQVSANSIMNEKKVAVKNILVTKSQLKKIANGEKYIIAMDSFVDKAKTNPEKVNTVKSKIDSAVYSLESKQWSGKLLSPKQRQLLTILNYLQARLHFTQLDLEQKNQEAEENKFEEILEAAKNPSISDSDKKELESAIISIQKNLLEKSQQNIKSIIGDFEDYFNYESKGDFEMNFKSDHESIGSINAEFKLSDYVTQASNFDSRFNGHISAVIDALPKGEDAIKAEMSSFVDFISKDGQMYALVKDLNITTEENLDDFQDILDTLKELAQENKYIELSDQQTLEAMKVLKSFNPDLLFKDAQDLFSKPMFTAYKKEGDIFHIIPTKYACDTLKVLANKFDPFSPNSCTKSQYDEIVEDLLTQGELTMTLGDENVMKYSYTADNTVETFDITVTFTDSSINKLDINIIADQQKYKNEKFILNYEKNKKLDFVFYADNGNINIKHESTLDSRNNFSNLTHTGYIKEWKDEIIWNINIKNRKIEGNFKAQSPKTKYNYEKREYEDLGHEYFEVKMLGTTNNQNKITSINIDYIGNDGENDLLTGELVYNLPELKFISVYQDSFGKANVNFEGKWNTRNQNFDNFDTQVEITQKERTFDYDTYKYQYSGEQETVFELDYSLENSQVKGTLNAYDNKEVIFGVITDGTYKKDQLQLDNELTVDFINSFFGHATDAKNSKRYSDIRTLASAIEVYSVRNGKLPNVETFWTELGVNKDDFVDPDGNIEKDGCKFGYTYAKNNQYYQLASCIDGKGEEKRVTGNYYDGLDVTLGEPVYLHNYTTWTKQETKEESTPIINVNFDYDYTSNKTNSELYIDAIYEEKKVFEMNMKNTGNIEYKKIDIQAPSDTVPMEEVIETNNYYY